MDSTSTAHIIPARGQHTHTIILLHGRSSTGTEFALEFLESQTSDDCYLPDIFPNARWVFPTSQMRNSARFEFEMSQWFDMWSVENPDEKAEMQIEGLRVSVWEIVECVRRETLLVSPDRIILGGISQGCAVGVHALLCGGIRLGGFVGLSSWLPLVERVGRMGANGSFRYQKDILGISASDKETAALSDLSTRSVLETPVFLSHSSDDEVVPISNGKKLATALEEIGLVVSWREYEDGGHWINEPQGVDDIVEFIRGQMKDAKSH